MQIAEEEKAHKLKKMYILQEEKNSNFRTNYKRARKNNNVFKK